MAQYIIHAVPDRMWYVDEFLVPSMLKQGINQDDIQIYNDDTHKGNLKACMDCFISLSESGTTWHLQDDVIISRDFKEQTEKYDNNGIVCGFGNNLYDYNFPTGEVDVRHMWFSFQCIHIPNAIAKECADWHYKYMDGNFIYEKYWKEGLNDDWVFRQFLKCIYPDMKVLNLAPNIVNHVDYLLGGSKVCDRWARLESKYWKDAYLIQELEKKVEKRNAVSNM